MQEMCLECSGTGNIACEHCGGSGNEHDTGLLDDPCRVCDGSGRAICPHCRGTGRINHQPQTAEPQA